MNSPKSLKNVAVIGGGPAGLMAAETLSATGIAVTVYERKPSLGRKFLMAGRGGLNLTHSEPLDVFMTRYGAAAARLAPAVTQFPPQKLRDWAEALGEPTFVGTSGRVFPKSFKASPLLRAWQARLVAAGIKFVMSRTWAGWDKKGNLVFTAADGTQEIVTPAATVLALGGASWPRLGSDGSWASILAQAGIAVAPLRPSNCGFTVAWSDVFRQRFAGQPVKPAGFTFAGKTIQGEAMMTERGIEGGAVYALSALLREEIAANGHATLIIDLRPGVTAAELTQRLSAERQAKSFSNFLRKVGGLSPVATGLLYETKDVQNLPPGKLAELIKSFPLRLDAPFPIDRAISSAGGILFDAVDDHYMLKAKPGVFVAGEMLDWEAPTGGYLLQATFSTAVSAAQGVVGWLQK